MRRTLVTVGVSAALGLTGLAGPATAAPAAPSVVGGAGSHIHHVHTGSGCIEVGVPMEPDDRGLHGASIASGGLDRGPWHGACHP